MPMLLPVVYAVVMVDCSSGGMSPMAVSAARAAVISAVMLSPTEQFRLQRPQSEQRPNSTSTHSRVSVSSSSRAPTQPGTVRPSRVK